MPVFHHIAAAALAVRSSRKWIDNILARHDIPGVEREHRGVTRRIGLEALRHLAIVRLLAEELSIPLGKAVSLAARIRSSNTGTVSLAPGLSIHVDLPRLYRDVERRTREAAEAVAVPRRGRPPRHTNRRR